MPAADGGLRFETDDGYIIGPTVPDPVGGNALRRREIDPMAAVALDGSRMQFEWAVSVTYDACAYEDARARAPA